MPLINDLRAALFGTSLAVPHSGPQVTGKELCTSARVQRERELNHETAINPSVVSNLARKPSVDHVRGHPVCAVARPLTGYSALLSITQGCCGSAGNLAKRENTTFLKRERPQRTTTHDHPTVVDAQGTLERGQNLLAEPRWIWSDIS